jgi:hypothetical protein
MVVSFIGGGKRRTQRKPHQYLYPTKCKTKLISCFRANREKETLERKISSMVRAGGPSAGPSVGPSSYIMVVSFIGGGKRRTQRKPLTYHKSLTNFIT